MADASKFKFRKNDRIGDVSAEDDTFLAECFIDTGDISILKDCSSAQAIVVGRTGSGKSALLCRLRDECEHEITVDLHALAMHYISSSTLLTFFEEELGVKLDLFYQFLWRHVFVVDLLKKHYNIQNESDLQKWYDNVIPKIVRNKGRLDAYQYLHEWGKQFWTRSEDRIREITLYVEKELSAKAGLEVAQLLTLNAGGKLTLSEQQTREIRRRGDEIVNSVQMDKLTELMKSLNEDILTDPKRRYYVIVDSLDERWVADETLRVWMIRGLLETVSSFNRTVRYAKIVVALRLDILRRVYRVTSDSGFQEEKYEARNLRVEWTRPDLERLLDERVQTLVKQRYTKQPVSLRDIMPKSMGGRRGGQSGVDYLLDRTLLRPRDAIQYLNACLEVSVGNAEVSVRALQQAEAIYSQKRRTAIADEWSETYPHMVLLTDLLKGRGSQFELGNITRDDLDVLCLRLRDAEEKAPHSQGRDVEVFDSYFKDEIDPVELRALLIQIFYTVGLVGVKLARNLRVMWSSESGPASLNSAEIHDGIVVHVHKAFWRVLGISSDTDRVR